MSKRSVFSAARLYRCLPDWRDSDPAVDWAPGGVRAPSVTKIFSPQPVVANPIVVPSSDFENVWNKTVAVVDKYFDIESENRLSRTIRTQPQMGATMLEPWALDSATFQDRLEASLQTIRRAAVIHVDPAPRAVSRSKSKFTSSWKTCRNPIGRPLGVPSSTTIFQ